MGLAIILEKVTDPYERKARLWPALLAMFPLVAMFELLYGAKVSILTNTAMLATSCGGLYLLTNVCRELGKRLESTLYASWGGKPTTQLLRHRDDTIEIVTKRRYHIFLSGKINEPFPDQEQEARNPQAADEIYQSAVRWLLNHTRDTKRFDLLLKENVACGFRRNALGLKLFGVPISLASLGWALFTHDVVSGSEKYFISGTALMSLPATALVSIAASTIMLAAWISFFTKASVKSAAFTYAETLLSACDVLGGGGTPSSSGPPA